MSSIACCYENHKDLIRAGRNRWKIENKGFNAQKRQQYKLHHKINRSSLSALKSYYNCVQIAHLIDQLLTKCIGSYTELWNSVRKMWEYFPDALKILEENHIPTQSHYPKMNYR